MNDDLKNILANSNKDINNQQLMEYLRNQLNKEAAHNIEQQMAEDDFVNDAIEGLQTIQEPNNIPLHLTQLNQQLHQQLTKNNSRKKRRWKDTPLTYLYIIALLLLLFISFFAIKKFIKKQVNTPLTQIVVTKK